MAEVEFIFCWSGSRPLKTNIRHHYHGFAESHGMLFAVALTVVSRCIMGVRLVVMGQRACGLPRARLPHCPHASLCITHGARSKCRPTHLQNIMHHMHNHTLKE